MCSNCIHNPDLNKPCVYAHGKEEVLKAHKQKMQSLKEAFATTVASGTTNEDTKCEGIRLKDLLAPPSKLTLIFNRVRNTGPESFDSERVSLR